MDKDIKTVRISHLVKKFGDFTAVDDISFEVCKGEIFGFWVRTAPARPRRCAFSAD